MTAGRAANSDDPFNELYLAIGLSQAIAPGQAQTLGLGIVGTLISDSDPVTAAGDVADAQEQLSAPALASPEGNLLYGFTGATASVVVDP